MNAKTPKPSRKDREQELLDEALEETFPASDTPALVAPGGGITGPGDRREQPRDDPKRAPTGKPEQWSSARA